jgi:hypothetical protein
MGPPPGTLRPSSCPPVVPMDHAWIWPSDPKLLALRQAMANRANTKVQKPASKSVKEFLDKLDSTSSVTKPVSGLLAGSHANNDGWIEAHFAKTQKTDTTYDEVIKQFTADNKAFLIPTSLHTGATPLPKFRIVGCQAGRAPEMLRVLKRVMGGALEVVGCKYSYEALAASKHGAFISFRYGFEAYSPTPITKLADLLTLFKTRAAAQPAEFSFIDGTPVPDTQWAKWAPPQSHIADAVFDHPGPNHGNLGQKIGKLTQLPITLQSRHQPRFVKHTLKNTTVPADLAAARAMLKQQLPTLPEFKTGHEFIFFRRKGNVTLDEYVDTFDWQFAQIDVDTVFHGSRHDYSMLVPVKVIDPAKTWEKQRLMFHFYPDPGSGLTEFTDFTDDEPTIFVTV